MVEEINTKYNVGWRNLFYSQFIGLMRGGSDMYGYLFNVNVFKVWVFNN